MAHSSTAAITGNYRYLRESQQISVVNYMWHICGSEISTLSWLIIMIMTLSENTITGKTRTCGSYCDRNLLEMV